MNDHQDDEVIEARLVPTPDRPNSAHPNSAHPNDQVTYLSTGRSGDLVQDKRFVLAVLFAVTGFLGLPLLWMNQRFSNTERLIWSIVVSVYTSVLIWGAVVICLWSWNQITGR